MIRQSTIGAADRRCRATALRWLRRGTRYRMAADHERRGRVISLAPLMIPRNRNGRLRPHGEEGNDQDW
jgi:hypothetical protein